MKFHLEASFRLSADGAAAKDAISNFFAKADGILQKGAPEGHGAKIVQWTLAGNKIDLVIESDRFVRAHDALLRLRRPLGELLGKQFRIGLRGFDVSKFEIDVESERAIEHKIPYVRNITFKNGRLLLELDVGPAGTLGQSEIENRIPDRIVSLLEEKLQSYGGKAEHWELLWESADREARFDRDPTEEMLKAGWIKHGASRGQWIYGPEATRLFRAFEEIVLEEIIKPLGYSEMIFPKLDTWDVWKKSGHAQGVYPEIYFVCPPKTRDPAFWEEVMDYYKVTHEVPLELVKEKIDLPIGACAMPSAPRSGDSCRE